MTPTSSVVETAEISNFPIVRWLASIILALVVVGVASQAYLYLETPATGLRIIRLFDLDLENNIPTYFATVQMVFAAQLTAVIAYFKLAGKDRFRFHWVSLAVMILCASVDEASSIHEVSVERLRLLLGADGTGYLFFAWVVPGMAFVALAGLFFVRFLLHLPAAIRNQMLLAAGVFLSGAVGVEMLGGEHFELWGPRSLTYAMYCATEETLEMLGVLLYIRAILAYLQQSRLSLTLNFATSQTMDRAALANK